MRIQYIRALDGLRGIAILLVMALHSSVPYMNGGFIGVDIFFVLSGFLITLSLYREFSNFGSINLRSFYVRRLLRLFPALLVLLILLNTFAYLFLDIDKSARTLRDSALAITYTSNWAYAFNLIQPLYLEHTWSLAIEEQFYILFPILFSLLLRSFRREKVMKALIGLAVLSWSWRFCLLLLGSTIDRVYFGLDTRLEGLLVGGALALLLTSELPQNMRYFDKTGMHLLLSAFPLAVLIIASVFADPQSPITYLLILPIVEVATCVLIAQSLFNKANILTKIFEHKVLVYLGRISYGLYLWHLIIYKICGNTLQLSRHNIIVLGTLLSIIVATLSFYVIEAPILRLKGRFDRVGNIGSNIKTV